MVNKAVSVTVVQLDWSGWVKEQVRKQKLTEEWIVLPKSSAGKVLCMRLVALSCPNSVTDPMDCSPPDSFVLKDSPGKNTAVGSLSLL